MTNAKGIDVSSYQAQTPPLAGLSFLIARASIGTGKDSRYSQHILHAVAAGLVTGAYHFGYNGISQDVQADIFLDAAGDVDFYFIDVEGPSAPSQNQTRAFIDRVRSKGKRCGLYHSASGYFDAGQDYDWVAKWSPTAPSRSWDFWQYRGSPLDLDQFHGTEAQLRAFAGIPPAPPSDIGDTVDLAGPNRGIKAEGGHGIFTTPEKNAANLIRNTVANEVIPLVGNEAGFQCVWLGDRAGFIANADVASFVNVPAQPAPDCSAEKALAANYHNRLVQINGLSNV